MHRLAGARMRAPETCRMRHVFRQAHAPASGTSHVTFRWGPHAALQTMPLAAWTQ